VKPLRVGRRQSQNEPHCRWEFKLDK